MQGMGYFDLMQLDTATNHAGSPLYDPTYNAIEIFNGFYVGAPAQVDIVLHDWFALLAAGAHYVGTANSDSHEIAYFQAGYPRTYVYTPGAGDRAPEPEVVLAALRAGHAFGTDGPMLLVRSGDALPGDSLRTTADSVSLQIRLMAAPWIAVDRVEVYRDGALFVTLAVPRTSDPVRLDQALTIPLVGTRSFFVLIARGEQSLDEVLPTLNAKPLAFTNPIWVESASSATPPPAG